MKYILTLFTVVFSTETLLIQTEPRKLNNPLFHSDLDDSSTDFGTLDGRNSAFTPSTIDWDQMESLRTSPLPPSPLKVPVPDTPLKVQEPDPQAKPFKIDWNSFESFRDKNAPQFWASRRERHKYKSFAYSKEYKFGNFIYNILFNFPSSLWQVKGMSLFIKIYRGVTY